MLNNHTVIDVPGSSRGIGKCEIIRWIGTLCKQNIKENCSRLTERKKFEEICPDRAGPGPSSRYSLKCLERSVVYQDKLYGVWRDFVSAEQFYLGIIGKEFGFLKKFENEQRKGTGEHNG
jgi:hypothetical protein